jgi:hypothetical protein
MSLNIGPPDFVGVGTNKSGTTWWHRLLSLHPGVHSDPERPKELHHFDPHWSTPFGDADVAAYHQRFPRPPGLLCGEWTPRYSSDVWVPPLLHRSAPDARWLLMLRDPWDRFVSEIASAERRGVAGPVGRLPDLALARSRYGEQLQRLRAAHPAGQILVLQYERCCRAPAEMLQLTQRFLGLDPWIPDERELLRPVNAAPSPRAPLPEVLRTGFVDAVRGDLDELLAAAPGDIEPELWPTVALAGRTSWTR